MKKLLLCTFTLLMGANLYGAAKSATESFIDFRNMEMGHKADWFKFMKNIHTNKYDILTQQHADWVEYGNRNLEEWANNSDCSQESKNKIVMRQLERAIALHKKHIAQYKKLCTAQHEEELKIAARHDKELSRFVNNFENSSQKNKPTLTKE